MTALEGGVGALAVASGQAAQTDRAAEPRRERRAHRVVARRSTAAPTTSSTTRSRSWASRSASSTTPTTSTRGRPRSARTRRRSTARASATRRATSSTSKASPKIAHDNGIPLVIDNTLATPVPAASRCAHGADIVVHSATKFIGGHGTSIGGIIVDGGKFDYVGQRALPRLHRARPELPRPRVLAAARGAAARAVHPQGRLQYQRDIGAGDRAVQLVPVPPGARDAEPAHGAALAERARGREVARSARRGRVGRVPGPESSQWNDRAQKYLPQRPGRDRRVRASRAGSRRARSFIDSLELFSHLANVGDVRSLAIHPASTTHQQLDAPRSRRPRASRPTSCACRSASRRSTTSSPTSTPGSAPPRAS